MTNIAGCRCLRLRPQATSTCDLHGDGDAVGFPVVSKIIPLVEAILLARSTRRTPGARTSSAARRPGVEPLPGSFMPPAAVLASIAGQYCATDPASAVVVRVENTTSPADAPGAQLVMRAASNASHRYPFVLQWLGWDDALASKGEAWFRMVMGPEKWLPASWPGCSPNTGAGAGAGAAAGLNLCPVSCMRKLARGSGALISFQLDAARGQESYRTQDGEECHRVSGA